MSRGVALLALCVLAASGCTSGSGDAATGNAPPPVPVRVAAVERRDIPIELRAIGTVEAFSTVAVKSLVDGPLAEVHFVEGDAVQKGQLLFVIDPRPYEAALRQAEANLAKDQAESRNATVEAERQALLFQQGLVSRNEFDNAQTNATALEAAVKADEAATENSRLRLQYCYIHSPVSGRVGELLVHEGNLVKQNDTTLAVVNQIAPAYAAFSVPEQWLPEIRERNAAQPLVVKAFTGENHAHVAQGDLKFVNNAVDRATGTVLLKGLFSNVDESLWPGQFIDVSLTLRIEPNALLVPFAAVQQGQQGSYVWVVGNENAAEVRPVVTGEVTGDHIAIRSGLQLGEKVVTDGQLRLAPGLKVEINDDKGNAKS